MGDNSLAPELDNNLASGGLDARKSFHFTPPKPDAPRAEWFAYRKQVFLKYLTENPIAHYVGKATAIAYALLCGIGSTAAVNDLFGNPTLALASGTVGFVVNMAIFWVCVPQMLAKIFSSQYSMYDESFEATINGNKKRIRLHYKNDAERRVTVERFSLRWWMITLFSGIFTTATALTYSGLLMSKLPETLMLFPGLGFLATGGGFLGIAIVFFVVSMVCNWAFNAYDASEQFAKNDFFAKLKDGLLELFLLKADDTLLLNHELATGNRPHPAVLYLRQLVRLGFVAGIATLGYFGITSVSQLGAAGLFSFFGFAGAPAAAVFTLFTLSFIGATFLYGISTYRFSTFAAKQIGEVAHLYAETGKNTLPKPLYALAMLTVVVPVLNILFKGLGAFAALESAHLKNAIWGTPISVEKNTKTPSSAPAAPSFKERLLKDASSAWKTTTIENPDLLTTVIWNFTARPVISLLVGIGHFVFNNIFGVRHWFMHGMAMINAIVNNAALAYPGDAPDPSNPNASRPDPFSGTVLLSMTGNAIASGQAYVNSVVQKQQVANGNATTTEETYGSNRLIFTDVYNTNDISEPYVATKVQPELLRRNIVSAPTF